MKQTKKTSLLMLALLGVLAGCAGGIGMGSPVEKGPVSTGPTVKELKSSPCACTEIPMRFNGGDFKDLV